MSLVTDQRTLWSILPSRNPVVHTTEIHASHSALGVSNVNQVKDLRVTRTHPQPRQSIPTTWKRLCARSSELTLIRTFQTLSGCGSQLHNFLCLPTTFHCLRWKYMVRVSCFFQPIHCMHFSVTKLLSHCNRVIPNTLHPLSTCFDHLSPDS